MSVSSLDIESGDSATTSDHFVTWMLQLKFHMDDDSDSLRSLRDSKLEYLEKANSSIRSWQQEGLKDDSYFDLAWYCHVLMRKAFLHYEHIKDLDEDEPPEIPTRGYPNLHDSSGRNRVQRYHFDTIFNRYADEGRVPVSVTELIDDVLEAVHGSIGQLERETAERAFNTPSFGTVTSRLDESLLKLRPSDGGHVLSPVRPIVQSPGTGKTRTVLQLASMRLGFYVNVRDIAGSTLTSVPNQDPLVYKSLVSRRSSGDPEQDYNPMQDWISIGSWLCAYLDEFLAFCEDQAGRVIPGWIPTSVSNRDIVGGGAMSGVTPVEWENFVKHIANALVNDIVPGFRMRPQESGSSPTRITGGSVDGNDVTPRTEILRRINSRVEEEKRMFTEWITNKSCGRAMRGYYKDRWVEDYFASQIQDKLQALSNFLPRTAGYCFLAIDNASSMGTEGLEILRKLTACAALNGRVETFRLLLIGSKSQVAGCLPHHTAIKTGSHYSLVAQPFVDFPLDTFLISDENQRTRYYRILFGYEPVSHNDLTGLLPKMGRALWNSPFFTMDRLGRAGYRYQGIDLGKVWAVGFNRKSRCRLALASHRVPVDLSGRKC